MASTLTELVDSQMVQDRLWARLTMAFGIVALLLAAMGLYGVLSYRVSPRTNETRIRKEALGEQHSVLMIIILRETGYLLFAGLLAGTFLAAR